MTDRLDSWKEIASHFKRSVRTVTRWEQEEGLPVHRHVHSKAGSVYAYKTELDHWWAARGSQLDRGSEPERDRDQPDAASHPPSPRHWQTITAVAALVVAGTIGAFVWLAARSNSLPTPSKATATPTPMPLPLTTYPGIEGPPSLSPDGNQVAFERDGDIFVKQVDSEASLRLTNAAVSAQAPAWSPDGRHIAFTRAGTGIFLISPLGGTERKVANTRVPPVLKAMAWTPDGRSLVISEMTTPMCASLFLVSVATGEKMRLTWPPEPSIGDGWPAVSPDGQLLAFARYAQDSTANIYLMPPAGGSPRQVTADKASLFGVTWTVDAKQLVFSSNRSGVARLWRLAVDPSPPSPIASSLVESTGENARFPSISRPGPHAPARLAYQRFEENLDIRRAELAGAGTRARTLKRSSPFIASTKSEDHPQYSPDGSKIAFVSTRSGTFELWLSDRDGSHVSRLTSMGGPILVGPRWSPDSRRLAFFATTGTSGKYLTYVIDAEGGPPSRLSRDDRELEALPTWSRDGRWLYVASGRSGALQIWKRPLTANGDGELVQLTRGGGAESAESPDGRFLYYAKVPEVGPGLWSIPIVGGEEHRVLDTPRFGYWTVARTGIYFVDFSVPPEAPRPVKFYDFATRTVTQIGTIEKTVKWSNTPGFAMSPDERWLLYSSLESVDGDLMWVDNFR